MERVPNPELERIVLDALAEKYNLLEKRTGIHLSSLVYCLTKSYLDLTSPLEPSDTELWLFSTGYGLEHVMTPAIAEAPTYEVEGIFYRPDCVFPAELMGKREIIEMKSTRAGKKKYVEGALPETWISYMKGGCHMLGMKHYNLVILHVSDRPVPACLPETIYFTDEEIAENWEWLLIRRDIYRNALDTETVPTPFEHCADWMCKTCRYGTICETIVMLNKTKGATNDSSQQA